MSGTTKTTSVRLDLELFETVTNIAHRDERSFSQQVQFILRRYLAEHPEIMPEGQGKKGKRT